MKAAVLVDLDGTVADTRHRKAMVEGKDPDWLAYSLACHGDRPIKGVIALLHHIQIAFHIVLLSGRHEEARERTVRWLAEHDVPYDQLVLRPKGDFSQNVEMKRREVKKLIAEDHYKFFLALDDYPKVAHMLTEDFGIPCLLVARDGVQGWGKSEDLPK